MLIDRYLIKEVAAPFALTTVLLLGLFVVFSLSRYLTEAVDGLITPAAIGMLALLRAIVALDVLLPLALYLAALLALSRLYGDFEVTALRASGMGELRLLRPLFRLALLTAALVAVLTVIVRPWAYAQIYQREADAGAAMALERIRAGQFYQTSRSSNDAERDDRALFIQALDADRRGLKEIFVRTRIDGSVGTELEVVTAPRGQLTPYVTASRHRLLLNDARVLRVTNGGTQTTVIGQFDRFDMQLSVPEASAAPLKLKALPTSSLGHAALPGDPAQQLQRAELAWRRTAPLVPLVLVLLALPLARSRPRQSRFARVVIAAVLYAAYFNLLGLGRSAIEQGDLPLLWPLALAPLALLFPWLAIKGFTRPARP